MNEFHKYVVEMSRKPDDHEVANQFAETLSGGGEQKRVFVNESEWRNTPYTAAHYDYLNLSDLEGYVNI